MAGWRDRLFRTLLWLFPREFRGDFGDEMLADFQAQRQDAASVGRRAEVRLWRWTIVDAIRRAPLEHYDVLRRDAAFAVRLFARRRALAISAFLTLTIAIGANAAVFAVVHAILWRALPLAESERLVQLNEVAPPPRQTPTSAAPANIRDWNATAQTLDGVAGVADFTDVLLTDSGADEIDVAEVSRGFFRIVDASAEAGRLLSDPDHDGVEAQIAARPAKGPAPAIRPGVAVISHAIWQRHFGGRHDVVGQTAAFRRAGPVQIVGVLHEGFRFPLAPKADVWFPGALDPAQRRARYYDAVARLRAGATVRDAQAELDVIASQLAAAHPAANKDRGIRATLLRHSHTEGVRAQLWFLVGAAGCVLLIASVNVVNLLLALMSGRRREMATRTALGATRAHLARQAITEGMVLAGGAGLAGIAVASALMPWLVSRAPASLPRLEEIAVGWPVVAFGTALALAMGITCGIVAVLAGARRHIDAPLRLAGAAADAQESRVRQGLVVAEIALALVLGVATALLVQTMRAVTSLPLGYDPSRTIAIGISPDVRRESTSATKAKLEADLVATLRSLHGVVAAGVGLRPLSGGGFGTSIVRAEDPTERIAIAVDAVGPGYLEALQARIVTGRFFDQRDTLGAPRVAVVNEAAARAHWAGSAAGRTLVLDDAPVTIVGVINDVRRVDLEADPAPTLYVPSAQTATFWTNNILVRASGDPRALLPAIRTVVRQVDSHLPLTRIETLEERLDSVLAPRRFTLWLVGAFSLIALVLALVGVYGVVAESVTQRSAEIGIRMVLGATSAQVLTMVLRQGAALATVGLAFGLALSLAANGLMSAFVFRVTTTDPAAYGTAVVVLLTATLAACALPARRALRVDPATALRAE